MTTTSNRRDLFELWLAATEGAATDAQLDELNERIRTDAAARDELLSLTRQQGWLAWNAAALKLPAAYAALAQDRNDDAPAAAPALTSNRKLVSSRTVSYATAAALLIACTVGFLSGRWLDGNNRASADNPAILATPATMISGTGCVWGAGLTHPADDEGFAGGNSLQLLEGLADFKVRFHAASVGLQMEGPASVVLTAEGTPSLSYGKIIIDADRATPGVYPIETPFGRVQVEPGAEVGLVAFGSTAEVHCFRGRATVESPWLQADGQELSNVSLAAGESLKFADVGAATLEAQRGAADRARFIPQVSMTSDFLSVSPDYVRTIVADRPAAYWRFEDADAGVVRNEMGDAYASRVKGQVEWVGPQGNRALELGREGKQGLIEAEETWDEVLADDFTIEAWIKPSHYHLGSIVGFVGEFDPELQRNRHGVLLETCGPSSPNDWSRLRQLRFLHRSQLTANPRHGVSTYSGREYSPRRWQHVVAVKSGADLQLYLDGQLIDAAHDEAATPGGLHLVIGQLYTETVERFFIGQLDEMAIYPRALTPEQVHRHHELLRPAAHVKSSGSLPLEGRAGEGV